MTVFDALVAALRKAAEYNRSDLAAPACVLWTDKDRQWEPLLPRLREALPVLTLGGYAPAERIGPAIWLRCMLAKTLPDVPYWPDGETPIVYLPGISRQEMRAVDECPRALQPLAELQYRGVFFSQKNARDWTVNAFLVSGDGGLGIEVAKDEATREAMLRALTVLASETVDALRREAPLNAGRFNALLNPDPERSLLLYLDDPAGQRKARDPQSWDAFRAVCREQFGFDPETDGDITAARLLGEQQGGWYRIWQRFAEAPQRYPKLPERLRRARPAKFYHASAWPQDNEEGETRLRDALLALKGVLPGEARARIGELEDEHGIRRGWVWAELGQSPLAMTLPALVRLAEATTTALAGPTPDDIARVYTAGAWKADAAMLDALAVPEDSNDVSAVKAAIEALYRPWLMAAAEAFQAAVKALPLPAPPAPGPTASPTGGRCLLFADGLRFDCAQKLAAVLEAAHLDVESDWRWGALPGVTPTAKPAASPVASLLGPGLELAPKVLTDGANVTADIMRRELTRAGYEVLAAGDTGTATIGGWTEIGNIDSNGHAQGWLLAKRISEEVMVIARRIQALLDAGWREVQIVTDHGWLLLPGGLPKADLPEHLTEPRKGRCARLKSGADTGLQVVPWRWDATVSIAVAPGIACFEAGKEYDHGGLSPQECVTPVLTVRRAGKPEKTATIGAVRWIGLRCKIQVENAPARAQVDIRSKPADPTTSIAQSPKALGADGQATLPIPDDALEGTAAMIVLLAADGTVLAQTLTQVGGSD